MTGRDRKRRPLAFALALMIIASFAVASAIEVASSLSHLDVWIEDEAALVIEVVGEALKGVTADLESVAGFVELADPDSDQFEQFVDRIDGTASAVGIGYLTELDAGDFEEFTADQRALYGPEYGIFGVDDVAEPQPIERAGRTTFYPVHHFALGNPIRSAIATDPEVGNIGPGLDAGFDPIWRADIARALDIDRPTFSGFTTLNMDFVVLDRVFFASVPVAAGPETSRGLVVAMMVEKLLLPDLDREVLGDVEWEAIPPGSELTSTDKNVRVYPLELPGTTWSLAIAPTDEALAELQGLKWWMTGAIAATVAFFAALALWLYVDRRSEHKRLTQYQQLAEDKDRFLASISHELRTPLTVVSGLAYELNGEPDDFSPEERNGLMGMLVEQTDELSGIVEDLLIAARSDIARVVINYGDADLGELAAQTLETAAVEATTRGVPGHAHADPQRVRQILRNLLTNAKRYGGPQVRIDFAEGSGWTEISVADNGQGVPAEKRETIFRSYESAHSPGTNVGSVGLGLYISRTLARAMGGDLEYVYDGTWSHFRLRLPSAPSYVKTAAGASTVDRRASV
jgi:signal transduction histidine kinase